ncbi:DUF3472 domain-containing protein [Telmatocola sphagniphila]|uniref:DUF3472 domain-containing protein n=1 Tax=Telmatocola sphagniphila TaxID=1123043 RepID=A0A8E6B6M2_9BACT|nr:DUF3472 domain-containing protein [Telmatocola sphagniphila]QVL32429.1 DUF3472 domain-containing protein [Telmatocola sphagniphila]
MRILFFLGMLLGLEANLSADEHSKGNACRSVHLGYSAPEATMFYNEVTVKTSQEGTYFCVCGFNQGYFGIQELSRNKKVVIFSIWDPGNQNDPSKVKEEDRVKLLEKGEGVRIGRFGNEGTGGQSFLDFDWKVGETYRFLVKAKLVETRTVYDAYFYLNEKKEWKHLVSFSTLAKGKILGGYYSFIEDFRRNKISATQAREAYFGNGYILTKDGAWQALTKAQFTGDDNPSLNINSKVEKDRFYLATGGEIENKDTKLNAKMTRPPTGITLP